MALRANPTLILALAFLPILGGAGAIILPVTASSVVAAFGILAGLALILEAWRFVCAVLASRGFGAGRAAA